MRFRISFKRHFVVAVGVYRRFPYYQHPGNHLSLAIFQGFLLNIYAFGRTGSGVRTIVNRGDISGNVRR
jgi:hypothetical protein